MRVEFEKLAAAGKITTGDIDALVAMATEGFCRHRSWGVGRIITVDTVLSKMAVDFKGRAGHSVALGFAVSMLTPIAKAHIEARKANDLAGLKQMAALHHLDVIKLIVDSYGREATPEKVQSVLVPDIIEDDYKKWWEVARREMRKDGRYHFTTKKNGPIVFQERETSAQLRVMFDFHEAKGLKARVAAAQEIIKSAEDLDDRAASGREAIAALHADIQSHARTQPALALEAVFVRDDLRAATGVPAQDGDVSATLVWGQNPLLSDVLAALPAAKQGRALESYRSHAPGWAGDLLGIMNHVSSRLCHTCAQALANHGQIESLRKTLNTLINQHQASGELLLWLARERSDTFAEMLGPDLLRAIITAIDRLSEKKANALRDYIVDDADIIEVLTQSADIEVVRDITRSVQLSPSFEAMDKRSVLGKLVKCHPALQSFIAGEQSRQDNALIVSWESLDRRKVEYEEMVKKKIPGNSHEIAIARSYGDLRENHEYKAAKEMQKILMRRKNELEMELDRARGTDFVGVSADRANVGTRVTVLNLVSGAHETYALLGAWDGDPDHHIISYLTPVGQALLNHHVGEEVEMDMGGQTHRYRIESIAAYRPADTEAPAALPA